VPTGSAYSPYSFGMGAAGYPKCSRSIIVEFRQRRANVRWPDIADIVRDTRQWNCRQSRQSLPQPTSRRRRTAATEVSQKLLMNLRRGKIVARREVGLHVRQGGLYAFPCSHEIPLPGCCIRIDHEIHETHEKCCQTTGQCHPKAPRSRNTPSSRRGSLAHGMADA